MLHPFLINKLIKQKEMKRLLFSLSALLLTAVTYAQTIDTKMVSHALSFIDVPYVANTLEFDGPEELVINCDEVDCTTFVEYVMAMALSTHQANGDISETEFADNLMKIRYRNGKIDGYTSRLHYVSDWINNGIRQGLLQDVTAENSPYSTTLKVNYMTTHPSSYKQLANSAENVATMKKIESSLTGSEYFYLPKEQLGHQGKHWIKNGDIICFTSNVDGLDVSHMGIAFYADSKLTLIHASSVEKKVVVSKISLAQLLENNSAVTGIRVLRVK